MNMIFEALQKQNRQAIVKEATQEKYSVMVVNKDSSRDIVKSGSDLRAVISFAIEYANSNDDFKQNGSEVVVLNSNGSIFEIDNNGIFASDRSNTTETELRIIRDFMGEEEPTTKQVSVAFDIEVSVHLTEEDIEQLIKTALRNSNLAVSSYMEIHTID